MYYFIINPKSRTGKGLEIWSRVYPQLKKKNIPYRHFFTKYRGHARTLAWHLSKIAAPADILAVIGGDGTINEVINGLQNLQITLGYLPTGSGNDFARGMGIPSNTAGAVDSLLSSEKMSTIDLGCIVAGSKKKRFAVSCGFGFDAAICHETFASPIKKYLNRLGLGKLTYALIAVKKLFSYSTAEMTLTLDHSRKVHLKNVYFTAVMNQPYEGGGFCFCPCARNDDHYLDVIAVADIPKWKVLLLLPAAFFGKHTKVCGVHIFKCRHIHMKSRRKNPIHTDGEFSGIGNQLSVTIEDAGLNVITP